jgi:hypothetical protein
VVLASAVLLIFIAVALTGRTAPEPRPAPSAPPTVSGAVGDGPPTLAPALFQGKAARAYQVAREIPGLLRELYCHCRCDVSVGHRHLLDCYRDDHAAG